MAEWSNAAVLKTAEPETVPGFESSPSATSQTPQTRIKAKMSGQPNTLQCVLRY